MASSRGKGECMSKCGSIKLGELQSKLITLEGACHHCSDRSGASTSLISQRRRLDQGAITFFPLPILKLCVAYFTGATLAWD
jgi:hypothetical protein